MKIEVVLVDRDRLAREREVDSVWWHDVLGRFERELALLRDTDEHHAVERVVPRSILSREIILALAAFELDHRYQMLLGKCGDRLDEAVVQRAEGGRRGDLIAEVIAQEGAQLTGRLQPGHVAVEIQPVDTRGRQRDVVAQYRGDVGAWHRRRLPRGQGEHADVATPALLALQRRSRWKKDDRLPIICNSR